MKHIDDWLDEPKTDEQEKLAQEWLDNFRMPAWDKLQERRNGRSVEAWLRRYRLTCDYQGKRYRCTGASRMGDVWLTSNMEQIDGYELRVDVEEINNWNREELTK